MSKAKCPDHHMELFRACETCGERVSVPENEARAAELARLGVDVEKVIKAVRLCASYDPIRWSVNMLSLREVVQAFDAAVASLEAYDAAVADLDGKEADHAGD